MKTHITLILFYFFSVFACKERESNTKNEEEYVELKAVEEVYIDIPGSGHPQFDHEKIREAVKRQKANLVATLVYHGIPVKYTRDGKITIPKFCFDDEELIYGLIGKAKDTAWCTQHLLPTH